MTAPFNGDALPWPLRRLLAEWPEYFSPETTRHDNPAWRHWAETRNSFGFPEYKDLIGLLTSDVRPSVKARAALCLLLPASTWNPFYEIAHPRPDHHLYALKRDTHLVPDGLMPFWSHLTMTLHDMFYGPERDSYLVDVTTGPGAVVEQRNLMLLDVLDRGPEALKPIAFDRYRLRLDFERGYPSSYRPFDDLMKRRGLDVKWKRQADAAMRSLLDAEQGDEESRERQAAALRQYTSTALNAVMAAGFDLRYGKKLLARQIGFLGSHLRTPASKRSYVLIAFYALPIFFEDVHRKLRYDLGAFLVSDGLTRAEQLLHGYSGGRHMDGLQRLAEECDRADPELSARLQQMLQAAGPSWQRPKRSRQ